MAARILGIAYHLPEKIETNDDLGRENPDWLMGSLNRKSGISARHISAPDETASDLGFRAAQKLLARELVDPGQIDYLLYCTQSPDQFLPSGACGLQDRLKLGKHVGAFDINLGCSGYVYGLQMARALLDVGDARNVLLVTADTYTKYIHPRDRTVRVLFGDGGAASLIGRAEADTPGRIGPFVIGTDGAGAGNLIVPSGGLRLPRSPETARVRTDASGCSRCQDNLYMNGPAIFAFAITTVPKTILALLAKSRLAAEDIDWYVYHQANRLMLETLAVRSNVPEEKMVLALEGMGNTVSASIPIAIQDHVEAGKILAGQRLMLIGFGVGHSWGACIVEWG